MSLIWSIAVYIQTIGSGGVVGHHSCEEGTTQVIRCMIIIPLLRSIY